MTNIFTEDPIISCFAFDSSIKTKDQALAAQYTLYGSPVADTYLTLSNDTLLSCSDVSSPDNLYSLWRFVMMNYTSEELSVVTEIMEDCGASQSPTGYLKVTTEVPHPWSKYSEIVVSNSPGMYDGNHTVTERVSDTEFYVNTPYHVPGDLHVRSTLINTSSGNNNNSISVPSHRHSRSMWCDGINWLY